jgi:hypothetical protein
MMMTFLLILARYQQSIGLSVGINTDG